MGIYKSARSKTKEKIADAFWELYKEKPIQKITVKEITDMTGHSRNTFYAHYKDVYEILENIQSEIFELISEALESLDKTTLPNPSIEELIETNIDLFEEYGEYICTFFSRNGDSDFQLKLKELHVNHIYKKLSNISGPVTPADNIKLAFILSGLFSSLVYWYENKPCSKSELLEELMSIPYIQYTQQN